jgi:hypothetical protein
MSDSEPPADHDALVEGNPKVDRKQLDEALRVVAKLRQAGLTTPPTYKIDSPYERGPVEQPHSRAEGDDRPVRLP